MFDSLKRAFFWLIRNSYGLTVAELKYWAQKSIDRQKQKQDSDSADAVGGVCVVIPNKFSSKPLCCPDISDSVECGVFGTHAGGIGRIRDACPADAYVLRVKQ